MINTSFQTWTPEILVPPSAESKSASLTASLLPCPAAFQVSKAQVLCPHPKATAQVRSRPVRDRQVLCRTGPGRPLRPTSSALNSLAR